MAQKHKKASPTIVVFSGIFIFIVFFILLLNCVVISWLFIQSPELLDIFLLK